MGENGIEVLDLLSFCGCLEFDQLNTLKVGVNFK